MNSLRFLLVHHDPEQSEDIAARLAAANHTVLPTAGLDEAADALAVERFDAVLMESVFRRPGACKYGLPEFNAVLRGVEQNYKAGNRVPVIAIDDGNDCNSQTCIDAIMPEPIDAHALTEQVMRLARALAWPAESNAQETDILDPQKFREQLGSDTELMVEIIDLFLVERSRQEPEMRNALETGDFDMLARVAHTIKGSLGSLHAMRARSRAQELELAAKRKDAATCWVSLAAFEADLAELEPLLLALRQQVL